MVEDRLRIVGETGSYLVRESERNKGFYVFFYLGKNGFIYFKYVFISFGGCIYLVLVSFFFLCKELKINYFYFF